ncbi:MAG: allophanate hydrolase [Gammaproteobacteria bacterium]|nr:allophanate hydrolase [Gammaproteobacteria bacterium]
MIDTNQSLDIAALHSGYASGQFTPRDLVELVLMRIAAQPDRHAWIDVLPRERLLVYADALSAHNPTHLPLYGIPFAIKDNIDLAGTPTTAACPDFAYTPEHSAYAVQRLIDAGAIPIGKTNLDQFATGLVGTRSPYGACQNAFDADYIAGGSSSGSAVAVAVGQVSFALGTDTAGSGRVPAAFNNLIGVKPTRGLVSTRGVVPACRSLDCVSVFALCAADARDVLAVLAHYDAEEPFARRTPACVDTHLPAQGLRCGVPRADQLEFFGDADYARLFATSVAHLRELGVDVREIDFSPFLQAARLLYEGPWVAERYLAIREIIEQRPESVFPVTREIIAAGSKPSALDAFAARYRLAELKRASEAVWSRVDVILTPTAGTHYRIDAVNADPVRLNSNLGYYTNYMNLLDLCAVAVPAGFRDDGLPFGITLCAPAFKDNALLDIADTWQRQHAYTLGAMGVALPAHERQRKPADNYVRVAVCGAHMSGLSLNHQLTERGGQLLARTRTAPCYRLYALPGGTPQRPGLVRATRGARIEVEVWDVPLATFGGFVAAIPAPLGIGKLELEDGSWVCGFLCEEHATRTATDVTELGGWRAYLAERAPA